MKLCCASLSNMISLNSIISKSPQYNTWPRIKRLSIFRQSYLIPFDIKNLNMCYTKQCLYTSRLFGCQETQNIEMSRFFEKGIIFLVIQSWMQPTYAPFHDICKVKFFNTRLIKNSMKIIYRTGKGMIWVGLEAY